MNKTKTRARLKGMSWGKWLEDHMNTFHYARKHYNEAAFLAEYYRWSASRGFSLPGRNPITGKDTAKMYEPHYSTARREAIAVHKCQARFWIAEAKKLRHYGVV